MSEIRFSFMSPQRERRRDRVQLLSSAFVLFIALMDIFDAPTTASVTLGLVGVALGIVFLYCAIRYDHLANFMGSRFEILLFRLSGAVFLLNGIMLKIQGGRHLPFVNLALALFWIFGMPVLTQKARRIALLQVDDRGLHYNLLRSGKKSIPWSQVEAIAPEDASLSVTVKNRKKSRRFWLFGDEDTRTNFLAELDERYQMTR